MKGGENEEGGRVVCWECVNFVHFQLVSSSLARSCFREFKQALKSLQPNFEDEESLKVLNAEVESFRSGSELPGFGSRQGMSVWISREVEPWRELARTCASNVADMFVREGGVVGNEVCGRKHRLKGKFLDILRARVRIQLASVLEDVEDLVEGEKAMFTMSDEAIVEAVNAVRWQKVRRGCVNFGIWNHATTQNKFKF